MTTAERATTGIGSLPHHNIDAALAYSFRFGVPFLPQIPIRNPWEYMIGQALEGLPGLQAEKDGSAILNTDIWSSRAHQLSQRLADAFSRADTDRAAFEFFEPSPAVSSSWQPFVWELAENHQHLAKIQIAGPITCQWVLRLQDGEGHSTTLDKFADLSTQLYRLILARALAMTRRLQAAGVQPILFIDEPGLYGLAPSNPRHVLALQELKLLIQTLRKENVLVGMHCCSNTDWAAVLALNLNYLSIDTELSLKSLLAASSNATENFLRLGGRLSLGVIPTARSVVLRSLDVREIFAHLLEIFSEKWSSKPELVRKTLAEALFTPACGLALHNVSDAERVLEILNEFHDYCTSTVISRASGSA